MTGGGHGIGRVISLAFAGVGARVVVAELDEAAAAAVADECAAAMERRPGRDVHDPARSPGPHLRHESAGAEERPA